MDFIFFCLALGSLLEFMVSAIFLPFYPPLGSARNLSNTMIGFVFIFNPIGEFFSSLIIGKAMNNVLFG